MNVRWNKEMFDKWSNGKKFHSLDHCMEISVPTIKKIHSYLSLLQIGKNIVSNNMEIIPFNGLTNNIEQFAKYFFF